MFKKKKNETSREYEISQSNKLKNNDLFKTLANLIIPRACLVNVSTY